MKDKQLKDKSIKIQGKDYVMVKDRIAYFNETYPEGCIDTQLVSDYSSELIVIKARVWPDAAQLGRSFTGYSQAIMGGQGVNATAALENAETSAVGRALAMMGIGVIDSIASGDEIHKATSNTMKYATEKQIKWIRETAFEVNDQLSMEKDDKNGLQFVDDWIESILTVKPAQVPIWKVKDAVDKLKEPIAIKPDLSENEIKELAESLDDPINLDEIPY